MSKFTVGQVLVVIDPEDTWYGDTVKIVEVRDPRSLLREYEAHCANGQESFFGESDLAEPSDPRSIQAAAVMNGREAIEEALDYIELHPGEENDAE